MAKKPFYAEGLRFECQGSGKCCTSRGEYGYVYLTPYDRRRMAKVLGLPTREFTKQFCAKTEGHLHLKNPDRACQFLEGKRCGIYAGRPGQCRTWPFWPENLVNARAWTKEVASYCPGVGKGKLYTAREIRKIAGN